MRQPPPAQPASILASGAADPIRAAIEAMAPAFTDRARALAGHPAETAEAAAQLEYVVAALPRDGRYAGIPEGLQRELLLARTELRDALGVAETLPPEQAVARLNAAARALRAGDAAAAAAALPPPSFRPGGRRSVDRLADIGPLPQAAIASGLAARELARLDAEGRWLGGRPVDASGSNVTTFGLGGNAGVGY